MEENGGESYTFDLNLDFLDSTTTNTKNSIITQPYQVQSQINSTYDIESLANRIATVNDMTIQLKATKDENSRLHKEMQDFSESAMSIRSMYEQEKTDRLKFSQLYGELQEKYEKVESQLTNKTLHFEQIQSRLELEASDKKPIPYNDLALRYQRLALQLEEEKQLPSKDKLVLHQVKDYLDSKKLSPLPVSKKKSHSKVKSRDFSIQCSLKVESKTQESQCSLGYCDEDPKDTCTQGTQYTWYTTTRGTNTPALSNPKTELRTQGTQYISSTTTRGTSTSTFIKTQSVGTNFPEPVPPVSIEDIFKEMIFDVAPLSPMAATPPQAEFKEEKVEMKSIGTCTGLKNVRKPIDYVAANIKHSDSRPPSRNNGLYDRVKNEIPMMGMPTLNPFAGLGIPAAPMHNTVAELWNMLGHTIFALLQQNNGAAAGPLNSMNMNVVNDRMRNLSARNRPPSEQQRNCESQTSTDYFEQDYSREYSTATRSAATSPILPSELQTNQQSHSRQSFVPVTRSPQPPAEFQKIVLNKKFSEPVVSSSKKSSRVDEILQLFPEYFDSFRKRKDLKKLLKESSKNQSPKKKKRNSISCSSSESISTQSTADLNTRPASSVSVSDGVDPIIETPQIKPDLQNTNWKKEMFGDSDSDSSLDSTTLDYITSHTSQEELNETKPTHENKPSPNELKFPLRNNTSLELKRSQFKSPIDEDFCGFEEDINHPPPPNEVFCKPFLKPKLENPVRVSGPGSSFNTRIETNEECPPSTIEPTPKRKRRTKKQLATQANKICKLDETCSLQSEPETPTQTKIKKPRKPRAKVNNILSLQPTITSAPCANNKPLKSLSLNRLKNPKQQEPKHQPMSAPQNQPIQDTTKSPPTFIKPNWMNRTQNPDEEGEDLSIQVVSQNQNGPMVMKVENPPDSVFQDIKTCFSNQRADSVFQDIKTCYTTATAAPKREPDVKPFIGPIMPVNQAQVLHPEQSSIPSVAPKEDGIYRFLLQNQQNTVNMSPSIDSITNPGSSLNIINYYEPRSPEEEDDPPENNCKSSVTILNEQWISESNEMKVTKQESQPLGVVSPLEQGTFDLENMPICFIDDQNNILPNLEQPSEEKKIFGTNQGILYKPSDVTILPGFQEIKQGIKNASSVQFITPSNSNFQNNELQVSKPDVGLQLNRLPVIIQDKPSFLQNHIQTTKTIDSPATARDVKPLITTQSSYLVLSHQKQLNSGKEYSPTCTRMADLQENVNTSRANDLATTSNLQSVQFLGLSRSMSMPNQGIELKTQEIGAKTSMFTPRSQSLFDSRSMSLFDQETEPETEEKGTKTSLFTLRSQSLFGSNINCGAKSNEDLSRCDKGKESPVKDSHMKNAFKVSQLEAVPINSKYQLKEKTPPKSPIPSTSVKKDFISSPNSSDSECDLSIDFPPSPPPQPVNSSALDLSTILKTPEEVKSPENDEVHFKTPESYPTNNSLLTKVITNSTEKLVEDYIFNENPGAKFQVFLDKILDDVAPPLSPVSAMAPSEKANHSEIDSSGDEFSTQKTTTPRKYKRKVAPTAALAVKRSARIKAKNNETKTMVNSLSAMTIPNIELGKYTKKKTEQSEIVIQQKQIVKEEKINIQVGFFKEAMDEDQDDDFDNEGPSCEPIRRHSEEEIKTANIPIPKRKQPQCRINSITEENHEPSGYSPLETDSYLSLCKKAKESISLYLKSEEESPRSPQSPPFPPAIELLSTQKSLEESSSLYDESPASPPPSDRTPIKPYTIRESFETSPLTEMENDSANKTIISHLITNYSRRHFKMLTTTQQFNPKLLDQLESAINEFLNSLCLMMDTVRFVDSVLNLTTDDKIISKAIVNAVKEAPRPETEINSKIPDTFLSPTHRKLFAVVETLCEQFPNLNRNLQSSIEHSMFTLVKEVISIDVLMNLTQFYLAIIGSSSCAGTTNPARLFICKCLYFYNQKAIPMIYHTLCVYPTVLPQRIDTTYDRSDILISTIQSILMSTYYDPEKCDFMTRQILAKLRMFYNYESFKPPRDEVIENMMAKIRAGRFKNVSYALSLICKRMEQNQTEKFILNQKLLPLANEFYNTLNQGSENDEKIACVLECISFVIRPFSFDTDISQYVNLFGRFLNAASERKVIQEAAVAAILRTARFGFVQCFNAIYNFKPTYELSENLKLMLRSFIYKKGKLFLQALEKQAQELVAT
ncbi:uncharacterized protein LOC129910904 [Episyrphus balteatus]|uniref:uncharacterized protein LOC129910904 n=1 Tax=Episyrphus balteatus TaxID=286459 RepID=UPI00248616C1|nr:uncharacterized protein LOC129910904 [Episyrphus balteatus]